MSTAMPLELLEGESIGTLANNYMIVQSLGKALSLSETNIKNVPTYLVMAHDQKAWQAFLPPSGRPVRWSAADFREFVRAPQPSGLGSSEAVLRHMVKGTDAEAVLELMLRGERGGANNQEGTNQWSEVNRNEITVDHPATIPLSPDVPRPKRVRDYARESRQGTSVGYTLRRLERSAPELLEGVKAGDMSPNAAAVQAGFRDVAITIPADPIKASRRLLRHFSGERLESLLLELANHAGYALAPKE